MFDFFVQADYLADDAEQETVDKFLRRTCCGCLGSCCSVVRRVMRWGGT
jgi:hypothetical protein